MQTVNLTCYAYASNVGEALPVTAYIEGDIAIHRPASYDGSHKPCLSDKGWNVSHIPTGKPIDNARPRNLRRPGNLRDLRRWAREWQHLAPDAFAALRTLESLAGQEALGRTLLDASAQAAANLGIQDR